MFENVIVMVEQKAEQAASNDVNVTLTAVYFPQRDVQ